MVDVQSSSPVARRLLKRMERLLSTRPERIANVDLGRPSINPAQTTHGSDDKIPRRPPKRMTKNPTSASRATRYADYIEMSEEVPELNRSLEVTVDFTFGGETDESGKAVSFSTDTEGARPEVEETVEEVNSALRLHQTIREVEQEGIHLGDSFSELNYLRLPDGTGRLIGWMPLAPELVFPQEFHGILDHYKIAIDEQRDGRILAPWQVLHYAHRKRRGSRFGTSQWFSARKRWRLAEAVEDVLTMMAITAPRERNTYMYPFPDGTSSDELWKWMRKIQEETEEDWLWDDNTELQKRVVPKLETAEVFLPFTVETGGTRTPPQPYAITRAAAELGQLIDVLRFFQDSYFITTGVPSALVGFEKNVNAKATLEGQLQGFGLTVRNNQTDAAAIILDLYNRALLVKGIIPEKGEISVEMPVPLQFDAKLRAEAIKIRAQAAKSLVDAGVPLDFVLEITLEISKAKIEELRPQLAGNTQEAMIKILSRRYDKLELKPVRAAIDPDVQRWRD